MYTYATSVTLSYRRIPRTEAAYISYLISSLNIYAGKTPVPDSGAPFAYPSTDRKPYYNGGLFLDKSIDLTSISL